MSNESVQQACMIISLDNYEFTLEDAHEPGGFVEYKGKMEVSYDGDFLGIDVWEAPIDKEFTDSPVQEITLAGPDQVNLLVGAILALLESYNQPSMFNDKDIKEEYWEMVQKAKDAHAKKATE